MKRQKPILIPSQVTTDKRGSTLAILLEVLLLFAGMLGYVFCNVTALGLKNALLPAVLMATLSFGLMILLVWYKRVFFGVLGGIAGLSLIAFPVTFPLYGLLFRAVEIFYNYIIHLLATQEGYSHYADYMTMELTGVLEDSLELSSNLYAALILLSLIAAAFFALALFKRVPVMVAFIVPAITLIPFFFYGIVPHYAAFSLFLSALIGCYGQSVVQHMARVAERKARRGEKLQKEEKKKKIRRKKFLNTEQRLAFAANNGSFGLIVAGVMMAVTLSAAAVIYSRPILQLDQVRETIDRTAEDAMNTLFKSTFEERLNVAGYMEGGETLSLEVPNWRRLKVCEVFTRTDTPTYLRYRTTLEFTEKGWTVPDDAYLEDLESQVGVDFCEYTQYYEYLKLTAPGGDPLTAGLDNADSEEQGYITDQVTVYPQYKASELLGLPGGITSVSPISEYDELVRSGDTLLYHKKGDRKESYMFRVASPVLTSNIYLTNFTPAQRQYLQMRERYSNQDLYLNQERSYSIFASQHNTELPSEVTDMVKDLALEITAPYSTKLEEVQAIERYFRENYHYSTERKRLVLQDGTAADAYDQLYYFLYENEEKEGYCTLFATGMATMLRSLGHPARVATGYYVDPQMMEVDQYSAALYDYNYHAWVEVYFDGIGWLSFEPTPGYGLERNYYLLDLVDEGKINEIKPNVNVEYYVYGYIEYPKELPDPTKEEEEWDPFKALTDAELRAKAILRILLQAAKVLLVLLLIAAVLLAIELMHRRAIKNLWKLPPGRSVEKGYYYILRLMQLRGFKFFEGELLESFAIRADNLQLAELPLKPIVPILQKRLYSELELSEEERNAVAEYVAALNKAAFRRRNPLKALWYKLTFGWKPRHKNMIWKFK